LQLQMAGQALSDMQLVAPFDGLVATVSLRVGEDAQAALPNPAMVLIDPGRYYIDVEVDEVDIARIATGQRAVVTFDALPGLEFTGRLGWLSPTPAEADTLSLLSGGSSGVVSYPARIDLDPTDAPIRAGMTATTDVVLEQLDDVLRVPNWAVMIDRRSGVAKVLVRSADGTSVDEVEVELGLRNETYSQVVDGLEAGQEVVSLSRNSFTSLFE
jgi:HlyD family secretion protein